MVGTFMYMICAMLVIARWCGQKRLWISAIKGFTFSAILLYPFLMQKSNTVYHMSAIGMTYVFVPGIWNGFLHRTDYIHYDELYRNDILYNVGLFSGGKGAKDAVDACGSTCIYSSGNCSKCFSGTPDELKIKNGGLQENEKISGRISRHIYPGIYGMRGSLIHGWICGVSRCCRHCADSRFYGGGAVIRFWHGIGSTL